MKAIEKDRARRYQTASSMAADLKRFMSGFAIDAAPPSAAYRARKFIHRNKWAVTAGSLLALAFVVGLAGTSWGFLRAERQRQVAVAERNRADGNAYSANLMSASAAIDNVQFNLARSFLDDAPERLRGWEWRVLDARLDTSIQSLPPSGRLPNLESRSHGPELLAEADGWSCLTWCDGVAQRWSLQTGRLIRTYVPHAGPATRNPHSLSAMAVSADARLLSTATLVSGSIPPVAHAATWDIRTGEQIRGVDVTLPAHPEFGMAISADCARLHVTSPDHIWLLDTATGGVLAQMHIERPFLRQRFSADGSLWARSDPRDVIHVADARSLKETKNLLGHTSTVLYMEFSDDNRWLGSAADDDTARVWDLSASVPQSIVLQHPFRVDGVCFSPDASLVATVARDRAVRVWDRATGTLLGTYPNESPLNSAVKFSPDGRAVAAQERGGTLRVWQLDAQETTVLRRHTNIVGCARFVPRNPAGLIISCGWDGINGDQGMVRLWDADSGDLVGVHAGRVGDKATHLAVSRDGRRAAIAIQTIGRFRVQRSRDSSNAHEDSSGRTEVIDLTTGELVFSALSPHFPEWVMFGSDDRSVIMGSSEAVTAGMSRVHLMDAHSGKTILTRALARASGWSAAPSPDGQTLALVPFAGDAGDAAERELPMLLLDTRTLDTLREVRWIGVPARALALSADGSRFAACGFDGILRIHRTDSGRPICAPSGHGMEILAVAFSPDGTRVASAGLDRVIRLWDTNTFDQVAAFGGHEGHIGFLDWDQAGQRLVSCSGDTTVRIWEPEPIRTRVQAGEARKAALGIVEPLVAKLFEELTDPASVVDRLRTDPSLDAINRKIALQVVLATSLKVATEATPTGAE